jgi:hypothetical protein
MRLPDKLQAVISVSGAEVIFGMSKNSLHVLQENTQCLNPHSE